MDRPKFEVADVFRRYGEAYRHEHGGSLCTAKRRAMTAIEVCRTAVLGGHLEHCDHCGHQRNAYNSLLRSTLPKMPVVRPVQMARGPSGRTLKHSIFSRCVHSTAADCNNCLSE